MHLRSRKVQSVIHGLRSTGHLVVVMKPGEIEGMSRHEAEKLMRAAVSESIGEQE